MPGRALVVEDEPDIREVIRRMLQARGLEVDAHSDGATAARAFQPGRYDLLITDHVMPRVSGLDLGREVRARDAAVPIIFVVGACPPELRAQMDELAAHVLHKPFTNEQFFQAVDAALSPDAQTG